MKVARLLLALLLLAAALHLSGAGLERWRRNRQGRVYSDFEAEVRLRGVLDVRQLAGALQRRLGRPFEVLEPVRGDRPAAGSARGAFSVSVLHSATYERLKESRPMRLLYWLPEPNPRELLLLRAAAGLADGKRVLTTPAGVAVARQWLPLLGHLPSQLQVRDVFHEELPERGDGDFRPFCWGGVLAQLLLDMRTDFLVVERRRLQTETLPSHRAGLRVLAAVVPASPFVLAVPPDASPELVEALKEVLPPEISGPWALPEGEGVGEADPMPLMLSRATRRYADRPGGVPFEEACP